MKTGEKRAQISTFIVVALLILVFGGLLIYSGQLGPKKSEEVVSEQVSLSAVASSVNVFVNSCLKQESDKAIDKHGYLVPFSEMGIKHDIELGIPECTEGFKSFKQQGTKVTSGTPMATVSIQPEVVAISLNYPLTITEGNQRSTISEFSYTYDRDRSLQFSNGQVTRATTLTSQDKKAELLFPQGITITDYYGTPIDTYSIKEIDVEELTFPDNVASLRVYELDPAQFSGPVKVTLSYPEAYENPEELYVAWYDEENSIWHGIPTTRNTGRKTLSAELEHATKVGAVKCSSKENPLNNIQSLVFEQTCGQTIGGAVEGGSEVSGSCVDTITPDNLWEKRDGVGLYLNAMEGGYVSIKKEQVIGNVAINTDYPKKQFSSPCVIKDWSGLDKRNYDIQGCVVNADAFSEADWTTLGDKATNQRCVEVCKKTIKDVYRELYDNLKLSGGDGIVDGSICKCIPLGSDLFCDIHAKEISDPPTPGYESGIAGGYGILDFYIHPGGCVVDKDGKGTPDIAVYASDQDPILNVRDNSGAPYKKAYEIVDNGLTEKVLYDKAIAPKHYVINPKEPISEFNFARLLSKAEKDGTGRDVSIGLNPEGSDLKAGWNIIYFKVDEIQSKGRDERGTIGKAVTGCAHLWANAQIRGSGITQSGVLTVSGKEVQLSGGRCSDSSDCVPELKCFDGACRTLGKAGDKCISGSDCGRDYYCPTRIRFASEPIPEYKCEKRAQKGGSCDSLDSCMYGLKCFESKCREPGKAGDKCNYDSDCDQGLFGSPGSVLKCEKNVCTLPKGTVAIKKPYDPDDWYRNSVCSSYDKSSIPSRLMTRIVFQVSCD
ncbi:hypothetical protein HYU15_01765 [Candidatus Woesearchaeota archaeon]|nr:hypothetical protein [Candidatus Woesearchaeota archaeon]